MAFDEYGNEYEGDPRVNPAVTPTDETDSKTERIRGEEPTPSKGSTQTARESDGRQAETRKIVREEIARNYRPKSGFGRNLLLILAGAVLGAAGGAVLVGTGVVPVPTAAIDSSHGALTAQNIQIDAEDTTVENAIAVKAIPSIVGITTLAQGSSNPFRFGIPSYTESVGSGVIVAENGYILTNAHVVNGGEAESVKVLLANNEETEAKVLWADTTLDLAVLKIEKTGLPVIEFGSSDAVKVGDKAVAIGNPLGLDLQSTLTSGYISGLDRSITLEDGNIMEGLIQTDAAINAGNSGGALLNAEGKLIGINTAKPESSDGIGFAIPVSTIKPIVDKIVKDGTFQPLYLGISGFNLKVAQMLGVEDLPTESGVIVRKVVAGSPAADAGIENNDIIVAIDDHPVESMNRLKTVLLDYHEGDEASITLYKGDRKTSVKIRFTNFDPEAVAQ